MANYKKKIEKLALNLSFSNTYLLEGFRNSSHEDNILNQSFTQNDTGQYDLYTLHTPFSLNIINTQSNNKHYYSYLDSKDQYTVLVPNEVLRKHKHNYFEFLYILDGQVEIQIEDELHHYQRGDAYILNQNVTHLEVISEKFIGIYLNLSYDFLTLFLPTKESFPTNITLDKFFKRNIIQAQDIDYIEFTPIFSNLSKLQPIEETLYQIAKEINSSLPNFDKIIYVLIERLFYYLQEPSLYSYSNVHFRQNEAENLFEKTINYINVHKRKITRDELSNALNYNGNYISEVFLNHSGQTLANYNRNIYLKHASHLLLNTTLSITNIIKELGFENRTAFYNQFKKKYGVTPSQYRQKFSSTLKNRKQ